MEPLLNYSRLSAPVNAALGPASATCLAIHPKFMVRLSADGRSPMKLVGTELPRYASSPPHHLEPYHTPSRLQALGDSDGSVHILEYTGREWRRLQPHRGPINDICIDEVRTGAREAQGAMG
jgi:hypothetical protein